MTDAARRDSLSDPVPEKVAAEVRRLIEHRLGPDGAYDIVVHPASDHDGDPIMVVQVKHRLLDRTLDLKKIIDADRAARDAAWAAGEHRFLHVSHIYDPKQKVA